MISPTVTLLPYINPHFAPRQILNLWYNNIYFVMYIMNGGFLYGKEKNCNCFGEKCFR